MPGVPISLKVVVGESHLAALRALAYHAGIDGRSQAVRRLLAGHEGPLPRQLAAMAGRACKVTLSMYPADCHRLAELQVQNGLNRSEAIRALIASGEAPAAGGQ